MIKVCIVQSYNVIEFTILNILPMFESIVKSRNYSIEFNDFVLCNYFKSERQNIVEKID